MTSFRDLVDEDRRLVVLLLLEQSEAYSSNEYLLSAALPGFGHQVSQDRLRSDLAWLAEQGLVTVEQLGSLHVATATQRGLDAAAGRAVVPGVKRPAPRNRR